MVAMEKQPSGGPVTPHHGPWQLTLVLSLATGTMFAFCTPVTKSPDEHAHFFRAYHCSEGKLYACQAGNLVGDQLPDSLAAVTLRFHGCRPWSNSAAFSLPLDTHYRTFHPFPNTAMYSPVPYLPASSAIAAGRMANLTPLLLFYGGRLANVLAYAALATFAIRWMPVQKWMLFLIMLMPLPMFLAGSLSADVVTNGAAFLAIAMVLHFAIRAERVTPRSVAAIVLVFTIIALSKQVYCLLTLLFFMIPARKLGSRRQWALAALAVIGLPLLLDLAWCLSVKSLYMPLQPGVDPPAQLQYLLSHPCDFLAMLGQAIIECKAHLYVHTVGVLGFQDTYLPTAVYWLYWAVLLTIALLDISDECLLGTAARLISLAVHVTGLLSITALMYISWTAVGGKHIEGMQPRYLLPILPLALLPLQGLGRSILRERFTRRAIPLMPYVAILTVVIAAIASINAITTSCYPRTSPERRTGLGGCSQKEYNVAYSSPGNLPRSGPRPKEVISEFHGWLPPTKSARTNPPLAIASSGNSRWC